MCFWLQQLTGLINFKKIVPLKSLYSKDIRNVFKFQSRSKIVKNIQCKNFASQNCRPTRVDLAFGFLSMYNVIPALPQ